MITLAGYQQGDYNLPLVGIVFIRLLTLVIGDVFHAVEEGGGIHALFARKLELLYVEPIIKTRYLQLLLEDAQRTYWCCATRTLRLLGLENLQHLNLLGTLLLRRMGTWLRHLAISIIHDNDRLLLLDLRPGTRIWRKSTHEIVYLLGWLVEINATGVLENLWG